MPRIRTIVLVVTLCLLLFGCLAEPAMAGHGAQSGDPVAKLLPASLSFGAAWAPLMAKQQTVYVYITNTGLKYHRKGCRYLAQSRHKKTLRWVKAHGYKPCKVCKPPR